MLCLVAMLCRMSSTSKKEIPDFHLCPFSNQASYSAAALLIVNYTIHDLSSMRKSDQVVCIRHKIIMLSRPQHHVILFLLDHV